MVLLIPGECWAWGPATHLDFGLKVLDCLPLLPPTLARLLRANRLDFLYGSVCADIVVGKNMARYKHHCHNWDVALPLLDRARDEAQQAMVWGFLSHLAADVVAHNYFVPSKTVESFSTRTTGHTYWEIRFDQLAHGRPRVWQTLREVGLQRFPHHDQFLAENLKHASMLFPFDTSRRIFGKMMHLSGAERWRRTAAAVAHHSVWKFDQVEVEEYRRMSVGFILTMLTRLEHSRCLQADPTGKENLRGARKMRRQLKRLGRQHRFATGMWLPFYEQVRQSFRDAIYSPLQLPPVRLVDRSSPASEESEEPRE